MLQDVSWWGRPARMAQTDSGHDSLHSESEPSPPIIVGSSQQEQLYSNPVRIR